MGSASAGQSEGQVAVLEGSTRQVPVHEQGLEAGTPSVSAYPDTHAGPPSPAPNPAQAQEQERKWPESSDSFIRGEKGSLTPLPQLATLKAPPVSPSHLAPIPTPVPSGKSRAVPGVGQGTHRSLGPPWWQRTWSAERIGLGGPGLFWRYGRNRRLL